MDHQVDRTFFAVHNHPRGDESQLQVIGDADDLFHVVKGGAATVRHAQEKDVPSGIGQPAVG